MSDKVAAPRTHTNMLALYAHSAGFDLSPYTSFGQLTALQHLVLSDCVGLDAGAVLGLPALNSLEIDRISLNSLAALPDFLAQQQQLTQLCYNGHTSNAQDAAQATAGQCQLAASLTASSTLQHLDLFLLRMPHQSWQHMFPEGRTLPQLRHLVLPEMLNAEGGGGYTLNAADVHALARCCPSLQQLECHINRVRQLPLQPALSSLSHLTGLFAAVPEDDAAVQVITKLTALQRLHLQFPQHTPQSSAVFVPLQQCTALTRLRIDSDTPTDNAITALARLTHLVDVDLSLARLQDAQLLLLTPLVRVSRLSFSCKGLTLACAQQAEQAFEEPGGDDWVSGAREVKVCGQFYRVRGHTWICFAEWAVNCQLWVVC